jgi:CheY-like chemotaxis protein
MCHTLVIEDEPLIAFHMADIAEEAGATSVDFADTESGAVAAALVRKPDIILSDVNLLVGTGPAAVVAIHGEMGQVPVIFITASPEECKPCDAPAVVMSKPLQREHLLSEFARLVPTA